MPSMRWWALWLKPADCYPGHFFLFLGSFRSVLVPVVAIPVSLIGAIFLMQLADLP